MRRPRYVAALTALLLGALPAAHAVAPPYVPAGDAVVLETVMPRRDPALQALRASREQLARDPRNAALAAAYARAAIALGRQQSDPRYYGYAAAALEPWTGASAPPPAEIAWLAAVLQQQRHDFTGALTALDALLQRESFAPAHLTRAALLTVLGRPRESLRDCAALAAGAMLPALTCAAAANSLTGKAAGALASLDAVIPRLDAAPLDERLWTLTIAAEIAARLERRDEAARRFDAALAAMRAASLQDAYLLAAWADFALANGQADTVIAALRDSGRVDTLLLRLALAERAAGAAQADELARHREQLQARFAAVRARGETTHGREETRYALDLADDAAAALALAQANWTQQREPADAELLLRAAIAAHQPTAARPVLDWIAQTGIEDPGLRRLAATAGAPR